MTVNGTLTENKGPLAGTNFLIEIAREDWERRTTWGKVRFIPVGIAFGLFIPLWAVLEGFYDFLYWLWQKQPPAFKEETDSQER